MIVRGTVSTVEGERFRIIVDGRVSAPLPRLQTMIVSQECREVEISVGDKVLVAFLSGASLADGVVLGRVDS